MSKGLFPKAASSSPLAGYGSHLPPVSFFKKYISISASPTLLVFIVVIGYQLYMSVELSQAKEWAGTQIMQFPAQSTEYPCRLNGRRKQFMVTAAWGIFIAQSGCFHEALGCLFSQAFEKEKELCLPPKEEGFIWAFYDSSWCVSVYLGGKDWEI